MGKAITITGFMCMFSTLLWAGEPTEYQLLKEKTTAAVYKQIGKTIQDTRKLPTFNFEFNDGEEQVLNAWYNPDNNTINFGEGIYDLATKFGSDSSNVIAAVIAHELAHFYKDHGWGYSFGMLNENTDIADDIYEMELTAESRAAMEAEADYFGGIFCYMSGYNSLDVTKKFFETMYVELEMPDSTFGYPTKEERIAISENTREMLEELIPVFEAANYLTILGKYEEAASCYDHIITVFPSREMYNNAGVALALEALHLYNPDELDYAYPFSLDNETRLLHAGHADYGIRGAGETEEEQKIRLLNEALEMFEKATEIDKEYATGYLNQSLVNDLLGEPEMALAMGAKAVKLAGNAQASHIVANAHVAKGIAMAHDDDEDGAREEFEEAMEYDTEVAQLCIAALDDPTGFGFVSAGASSGAEITSARDEDINDLEPSLIEIVMDGAPVIEIARQNDFRPKMKVYSTREKDYNAYYVKTYSYPKSEVAIVVTPDGFAGTSARGIGIGAELAAMETEYGVASETVTGTTLDYHIYRETPIIFKVDKEGLVQGWALYGL